VNADTFRDPAVLIPIATFVLGFGAQAIRHWLQQRARRRVVVAELMLEAAKRTPDMADDAQAELALRLAKADELAIEGIASKADPSALAAILAKLLRR